MLGEEEDAILTKATRNEEAYTSRMKDGGRRSLYLFWESFVSHCRQVICGVS